MSQVLVTGSAGFYGRHLVEYFAAQGHEVRALDVIDHHFELPRRARAIRASVTDAAAVDAAVQGCDIVVHNAALVPITRAGNEFWKVNVDGTRRVLEAAKRHGVRKVVHVSSSSVHGKGSPHGITERGDLAPFGRYARSKAAAEEVCLDFRDEGVDITMIRPRPILGPGRLGILELLFSRVREGRRFYVLGDGSNKFQLVSVHDLLSATYLAATRPCAHEDFNIGAAQFTTLRNDLEGFVDRVNSRTRITSVPKAPVRAGLRAMDALRLSPVVSWHYETITSDWFYDTAKAQRVLGWKPKYDNVDTLVDTYQWYLDHVAHGPPAPVQDDSPHRSGIKKRLLGLILRVV